MPDLDFERAAEAAFIEALGPKALVVFRELVALYPGFAVMHADHALNLSENDKLIFAAVARKICREAQA